MMIDGRHYLMVEEAAEALATTAMRVLMLMREKELVGMQLEGEWLITADSVDGWQATGGVAKPVTGCATSCASARGCACKAP